MYTCCFHHVIPPEGNNPTHICNSLTQKNKQELYYELTSQVQVLFQVSKMSGLENFNVIQIYSG